MYSVCVMSEERCFLLRSSSRNCSCNKLLRCLQNFPCVSITPIFLAFEGDFQSNELREIDRESLLETIVKGFEFPKRTRYSFLVSNCVPWQDPGWLSRGHSRARPHRPQTMPFHYKKTHPTFNLLNPCLAFSEFWVPPVSNLMIFWAYLGSHKDDLNILLFLKCFLWIPAKELAQSHIGYGFFQNSQSETELFFVLD